MTQARSLPPRSEIADEHKWNAPAVFESVADWEAEFNLVSELLPDLAKYQCRLNEGPDVLAEWFEVVFSIVRRIEKMYNYAVIEYSCDTTNQEMAALNGRIGSLAGQMAAVTAFAEPEILDIGYDVLRGWIAQEEGLAHFSHHFENLFRQQDHVRSAEVEEVLGMLSDVLRGASNVSSMLTNADMQFESACTADGVELPVAQSTITSLRFSPDREARRTAYENYTGEYLAHQHILATNYLTSVKQDVFRVRVRYFESSLEASLFPDNIPLAVFYNLIDTYKANLPTWHRYWAIKRKAIGVDTLYPHDIWAPLVENQPDIPYEQAVDWIATAMLPLGEEYAAVLRRGCLEERWVDRYPNIGKRQGAFSAGTYDTSPFIMMSYTGSMASVSTLAHELGHSMHSYLANQAQPYVYADYSLFVAEVASNFNQAMTRAYLLKEKADDRTFQIALLDEAMYNFHRYFFIMPTLARFELEVHERVERGEGLGANDLKDICATLFAEGYGAAMEIDREREGMTWATFGHLFRNFYTYQYATGISAAHALAEPILEGREGAATRYLEMLKTGGGDYPVNVLKKAGVDLTQPQAIESAFAVLASYVDKLEELFS